MSGSDSDSDVIEFAGTKKVTIELLDDTDDDDDKGGLGAANKAIPVNVNSSSSVSSARKRSLSGVARAPSFPSKQRAHSLVGNTAGKAIDLCEDRRDAIMTTSRRSGPFATMTYQGRSQDMAIELDDSSSSNSSREEDPDSDDSSVVFEDKGGTEIPPTVILSSRPPDPYPYDSSDDEVTTLRERMDQRGHRAYATNATTAKNFTTAEHSATFENSAIATTTPTTASFTATSPLSRDRDRNRNQLREGRRAELKRRNACGSIPSPPRKKAPASTFLKALPTMGKSAQALQKSRTLASRLTTKVPDVIVPNVVRKSVSTVTEDLPLSSDDDDDDGLDKSNRFIRRKAPVSSLPASEKSARSEKHAEMEVDNDSVTASDVPTDGSVRDGTVCLEEAEEYGDFGVDDFGQYDDDDDNNDDDDNSNNDLNQPLECTFDDDTVVSVRAPAMRQTRNSRRSPSGSDVVDDSIDKENVKVVRRPMVPAATDRRLQAFADYDVVGMRDNETVVGDDDADDEDSLPENLFDNLGIDDCVSMNHVDRLSSLSEDPKTGLPVRRFTVHGGEDGKFN